MNAQVLISKLEVLKRACKLQIVEKSFQAHKA